MSNTAAAVGPSSSELECSPEVPVLAPQADEPVGLVGTEALGRNRSARDR